MTVVNCVGWWEAEKSITGGGTSDTVATQRFLLSSCRHTKGSSFLVGKKGRFRWSDGTQRFGHAKKLERKDPATLWRRRQLETPAVTSVATRHACSMTLLELMRRPSYHVDAY